MDKYMFLIRGGNTKNLSPEDMQKHMQSWQSWMKGLAETGTLQDGLPLSLEGKVVRNSGEVVTDGPYAEGKEIVGGYIIVNADDEDKAVEISKSCPVFEYGGLLEVRKILSMDM